MSDLNTEGWMRPTNSKKWHYFREMQSLCRKWGVFAHPFEGYEADMQSPDNCRECARRREKERSKERQAVAANEVKA